MDSIKMEFPNSYELTLTKNIYNFFCESKFCDIELVINDKRYPANKLILASSSLYCKEKIKDDSKEIIVDYDGKINSTIIENFFKSIYMGRLDPNVKYYDETLSLAKKLRVNTVLKYCLLHFAENLKVENIFIFYDLIKKYNDDESVIAAFKMFVSKHFSEIIKHESFLKAKFDALCEIFAIEELCIETEYHVFEAVKLWLNANSRNKTENYCFLFKYVKYESISIGYFKENVLPLLDGCSICFDILKSIICNIPSKRQPNDEKKSISKRTYSKSLLLVGRDDNNKVCLYKDIDSTMSVYLALENTTVIHHSLLVGDKFFFIGSDDKMWSVNLKSHDLKCASDQKVLRSQFAMVEIDNEIYLAGGSVKNMSGDIQNIARRDVIKWNIELDKWETVNAMLRHRKCHTGIAHNGKFYVFGGLDHNNQVVSDIEIYDPKMDQWKIIFHREVRHDFKLVGVDHYLYVFGGYNGENEHLTTVSRFDTRNDTFLNVANMPETRNILCACEYQRKIICLFTGGAYEYDIYSDSWKRLILSSIPSKPNSGFIVNRGFDNEAYNFKNASHLFKVSKTALTT